MNEEVEDILFDPARFRGIKLRAVMAVAARSARRVFPIIAQTQDKVQECDEAIAMVESFALGEPGRLLRVRRVAASIAQDNYPLILHSRTLEASGRNARIAISSLAEAGVSAFSAVTQTPPSESCCRDAFGHAIRAIRKMISAVQSAPEAVHAVSYRSYDASDSVRDNNAPWMIEAILRDVELIKRTHRGRISDLGLPVDPTVHGPLGPLWQVGQIPAWYTQGVASQQASRDISVVPYQNYTFAEGVLTVVCWFADEADASAIEQIKSEIDGLHLLSEHELPPMIIYVPGMPEQDRLDFVGLGATPFSQWPDERSKPHDIASLCTAIRDRLQEAYVGWKQDEQGLWFYSDARTSWRGAPMEPLPIVEGHAIQPDTGPADDTEDGTTQDYQSLLEYLKSADSREAEY